MLAQTAGCLLIALLRAIFGLRLALLVAVESLDTHGLVSNLGRLRILSLFLLFLSEQLLTFLLQFHVLSPLCFCPITLEFRWFLLWHPMTPIIIYARVSSLSIELGVQSHHFVSVCKRERSWLLSIILRFDFSEVNIDHFLVQLILIGRHFSMDKMLRTLGHGRTTDSTFFNGSFPLIHCCLIHFLLDHFELA